MELTDKEIEGGWHNTFSTSNPYCPCDLKSFTKAIRWAEHAMRKKIADIEAEERPNPYSSVSWKGFNVHGDENSAKEVRALIHKASQIPELLSYINDLEGMRATLEAERDALRKDAERWMAFRARDEFANLAYSSFRYMFQEDADKVIDAAIAEKEPK